MVIDHIRCVVLNATYEPLAVVSARRGLILVFEEKATLIESHPTQKIRSAHHEHDIPIQVVLKNMVKARPTFRVPAQLTQRNLFVRDRYTCQYCQRHRSDLRDSEFLTRDHVLPQARGGRDLWENVVTACSTCNNKKADYLLKDLEKLGIPMVLSKKPTTPTIFEIWSKQGSKYRAMLGLMPS
jgi:5-methylcytosine-specific restriction endonuclease McrA